MPTIVGIEDGKGFGRPRFSPVSPGFPRYSWRPRLTASRRGPMVARARPGGFKGPAIGGFGRIAQVAEQLTFNQ